MKIPFLLLISSLAFCDPNRDFIEFSKRIPVDAFERIPVQNNGRIKPFGTLAREIGLFINGSRNPLHLDPIQFYLGMITAKTNTAAEVIEVRNKDLRAELGFARDKRYYSIEELQTSPLQAKAGPLQKKDSENHRALTPDEKDVLEAYHQFDYARGLGTGEPFLAVLDFSSLLQSEFANTNLVVGLGKKLLNQVSNEPQNSTAVAEELRIASLEQKVPELFSGYRDKIGLEVRYNHARPFLMAGILYFCLGLALIFGILRNVKPIFIGGAFAVPLIFHLGGFLTRIYITGFAPVTNMYTTMLWVALGVAIFGSVLLFLYRNQLIVGVLFLGSSLVLLLTENFPLILSPDMDPIVAVLRSNYWLTLHVLTVTISYAAFTICMLIGNFALLSMIVAPRPESFYKTYAHYVYRMAQLGVCLITAGIILGGIWADYSWGRFWGWDPKETWALIADTGFIVLLHAKYIGWLRSFGLLAMAPVAYLLVIMAWYGVNFILAAGLHSYGFSSGGAMFVGIFVALQFVILALAFGRRASSMVAR